jgi:hypothetical protein
LRKGETEMIEKQDRVLIALKTSIRTVHKHLVVPFVLTSLGVAMFLEVLVFAAPKTTRITQLYTTAETSTSAQIVWNTTTATDSLLQYSTTNPVPASAPQIYKSSQVTLHQIELSGLAPGTVYFYKVTSCAKRGCVTGAGSFETFPGCPDTVPPVSGNWQRANSANVSGATTLTNQLLGVDALSQSDVWAVGWSQDPAGPQYVKRTLIQHFDGATWNIVGSPNPRNDVDSVLYSVSGVSANDVWAVGSSHNGTLPSRTLTEHWNGILWSIIPSPSPDSQLNVLSGVAAVSANNVWAVGYRGSTQKDTPIQSLILHWNGAGWTQVPSPNIPGGANQLFGVHAISANDVWAVGTAAGAPLALRWNGSAWNVVPSQKQSGLSTERLTAISAASANDVWAVGEGKGIFTNQTFATMRRWDGARWTDKTCRAASASNPPDDYEGGGPDAYFTGVAAAASNDVWAVGVQGSGPMILHWDGRAWTSVAHPRAFPNAATLSAVATASGGSAWNVGLEIQVSSSGSASPAQTLVHKYTP